MNCQNCGANIEAGAKFCPACGAPVQQPEPAAQQPQITGYCPRCGQPYYGYPAVCPSCGAQLAQQQQYQGAPNGRTGDIGSYFPSSDGVKVPRRSIALYVILSILTCGIFNIYWLICLVNDLNLASRQTEDTNGVTVWLLSIVTCGIYGVYWMYKAGDKVSAMKRELGETDSGNYGILYLLLQLFGFGLINFCLIQNEINKISDKRQ